MRREEFITHYLDAGQNFKVLPLQEGLLYYAEPWTDDCFTGPDRACLPSSSSASTKREYACNAGHRRVREYLQGSGFEVAEDFRLASIDDPRLADYAYGVSVFFLKAVTPPENVLLPRPYWDWARRSPHDGRYAPEGHIAKLSPSEAFVFGSNESGFHGAGSAGWAYTGRMGNQYRAGNPLLRMPAGTKGFWAVLGRAQGYQEGTEGRSYAICTILRPGAKRSMPLPKIQEQVRSLYAFARQHTGLTFLVTKSGEIGTPSLNGYDLGENASCYLSRAESTV